MLIRLLRTYLRPYSRAVAIVVVLVFIQTVGNLYLPNVNADIINNGVVKGDVAYIWRTGALMLGVAAVLGVIAVIAVYWASRASMGVGRDLRGVVFARVQTFSARELNRFGTASLITRNTNDVQQIQLFLQIALTLLVAAPIMAVGGVFMALRADVQLSALLIVVVPVMAAIVAFMLIKGVPLFRSMQGTSLVAGAVGLGRRRFLGGVLPASALWVLCFIGLGFFVGVPVERLISRFAAYGLGVGFVVIVALIWIFAARRIPAGEGAESVPASPAGWRLPLALGIDLVTVMAVVVILSFLSVVARGDLDDIVFAAGIFALLSLLYLLVARYTVGFTLGEALLDVRYHPPRLRDLVSG